MTVTATRITHFTINLSKNWTIRNLWANGMICFPFAYHQLYIARSIDNYYVIINQLHRLKLHSIKYSSYLITCEIETKFRLL